MRDSGAIARSTLDDELQEYYSLVARQSALQSEFSDEELAKDTDYQALIKRIETQRASIDTSVLDLASDTDFVGAVREIEDQSETTDEYDGQSWGTEPE
ncbi:HalX domain-containing protein [Haloarcula japonica]|uniref:HalX domain-containing protein n=1 Tax=Haloarcula japonica TaxID=29282 RepID=UPI0039F6D632